MSDECSAEFNLSGPLRRTHRSATARLESQVLQRARVHVNKHVCDWVTKADDAQLRLRRGRGRG
jgi:hypothetical protein